MDELRTAGEGATRGPVRGVGGNGLRGRARICGQEGRKVLARGVRLGIQIGVCKVGSD